MSIINLLNITVDVERPTVTQGDYGEQVKTWETQISSMPCRLQRKRASERIYGDRETLMSDYTGFCEVSNSIQGADRVSYNSEYYLVTGIDPDSNFMGVYQRLDLLKIE